MSRKKTDKNGIERLARAMTDYRERLPRNPSARPAFVQWVARRHHLGIAVVRTAITMMREMEGG